MSECNFNVGDRVQRLEGKEILGVVKEVRAELRKPGQKEAEASALPYIHASISHRNIISFVRCYVKNWLNGFCVIF